MVLPTFFGPPHMCAVCVDFKDRGQGGLFGATRSAYGRKRLFLAVLDPFGSPLVPLDGPPWPAKLFQCITGDVPWLDPPLFHTVPSVWSHHVRVRHAKCTWSSFCMFYLWLINKYEVHQRKKTTISNLIPEIYFELAVSASCWFGLLVIAHIYIITYCFMVYIFRSDHDLQRQSLKVVNYPIANITRQDSLVVNWDLS